MIRTGEEITKINEILTSHQKNRKKSIQETVDKIVNQVELPQDLIKELNDISRKENTNNLTLASSKYQVAVTRMKDGNWKISSWNFVPSCYNLDVYDSVKDFNRCDEELIEAIDFVETVLKEKDKGTRSWGIEY